MSYKSYNNTKNLIDRIATLFFLLTILYLHVSPHVASHRLRSDLIARTYQHTASTENPYTACMQILQPAIYWMQVKPYAICITLFRCLYNCNANGLDQICMFVSLTVGTFGVYKVSHLPHKITCTWRFVTTLPGLPSFTYGDVKGYACVLNNHSI